MRTIIVHGIMMKMGNDVVNSVMMYPKMQEMIKSGKKFDVCIIEVFLEEALLVSFKMAVIFER